MIARDEAKLENEVLAAVDAAFAEARLRAGDWLACKPGCDECCRKPFAITATDARRLQNGLALLDPCTRKDIEERASRARQQIAQDFPGDSGVLTGNEEWREWFFTRHAGVPCPVLNLETGECRLYAHRPVACRLAGPLIQIGPTHTDPCHLCFIHASENDIQSTKIVVDLPQFKEEAAESETLIAWIL